MIDERFYPATDLCDWEPLRLALEPCPIDGWMFMCATLDGRRFYKHSTTRETLALAASPSSPEALKGEQG